MQSVYAHVLYALTNRYNPSKINFKRNILRTGQTYRVLE